MRRGCHATFVHFHAHPFTSRASIDKARELVRVLAPYQLGAHLMLVPFGELQREVTVGVPGPLRVVVYRRLMLRIASALAKRVHARALVTGDAVGQVASQTLDNLSVIDRAAERLVVRPLVGMAKEEIMADAGRIGTFPISILPDEDCCTLFTPRHPSTRAKAAEIERAEADLPIQRMVEAAVAAAIVERVEWPVVQSSAAL
jgi:thiamine biosynthesis protein ThiI